MISIIIYIPFVDYDFEFKKDKTTFLGSVIWKKIKEYLNSENNDLFKQVIENTTLPSEINFDYVRVVFNFIQDLLNKSRIQSLHDISDGGLFTCLFEMAYSGFKGINIYLELRMKYK